MLIPHVPFSHRRLWQKCGLFTSPHNFFPKWFFLVMRRVATSDSKISRSECLSLQVLLGWSRSHQREIALPVYNLSLLDGVSDYLGSLWLLILLPLPFYVDGCETRALCMLRQHPTNWTTRSALSVVLHSHSRCHPQSKRRNCWSVTPVSPPRLEALLTSLPHPSISQSVPFSCHGFTPIYPCKHLQCSFN